MIIPRATYRIQFHRDFGFKAASDLVPALDRLGITHIYASPIFAARAGSTHGYDVVDPNRLNPELGSQEDFDHLLAALGSRGMGLVLDIVPNHMAANAENRWWMDVLENGAASRYAAFFGINWALAREAHGEKIFLPVLGDHYGNVLERNELQLRWEPEGFFVQYYSSKFPVDPATYSLILGDEACPELQEMIGRLPPRDITEWDALDMRQREKEHIKRLIAERLGGSGKLERILASFAGSPADPGSHDRLHELLEQQAYRLAYWKTARERSNYRRFFDVADFVGLRVDNETVFAASHALLFDMLAEGKVQGLRVDHIDGLFDPTGYLERLAERGVYTLVEKVLTDSEQLPEAWPVQGATGYEFLGVTNGLFIQPEGLKRLEEHYRRISPGIPSREQVQYERKKRAISELFAGEIQDLGAHLSRIAERDRHARDLSPSELTQALIEVTACLKVYRTYTRSFAMLQRDRARVEEACSEARSRNSPPADSLVYDFVRRVLTLNETHAEWLLFLMRWQQRTGPIMAKGVEDSAFYVYNSLVSLNEVGSWERPVDVDEFHRFLAQRRVRWPHAMNATSTHDTKRSEEVRSRINVLPEFADEWARLTLRWRRWLRAQREGIDPNDEYMLWQNMLGAWPVEPDQMGTFRERFKQYMTKALRESRVNSSWLEPNPEYESLVLGYVDALFEHEGFMASFLAFTGRIAFYGALNSLSGVLLKVAAPGVPDFYQGTLGWFFALVDPDNRRPSPMPALTDFGESPRTLLEMWKDGRIKIFVTETCLAFRRAYARMFEEGEYIPLQVRGLRSRNAIAFARSSGNDWAIALAPRFLSELSVVSRAPLGIRAWRDTVVELPEGAPVRWRNVFTGRRVIARDQQLPVHRVLDQFPLALLSGRTA